MELKDYCTAMGTELTAWKAKVDDVVRKLDKLPSGEKEKAADQVRDLHIIVEELSDRIDKLEKECPTEWTPIKNDIEGKFVHLRRQWESVWGTISGAEIGG